DGKVQTGVLQNPAAEFYVGAFHANHNGVGDFELTRGRDDARSQSVTSQNTTKDIDKDCLYRLVGKQDAEGVSDLIGIGATAHVEEVGRAASCVLDNVHGSHGQACAVDHAGYIAV